MAIRYWYLLALILKMMAIASCLHGFDYMSFLLAVNRDELAGIIYR